MKKSYIYIIKCHEYYKIGIATRVNKRLSELQVGNPYKIELVERFEIDPHYILSFERRLHAILGGWNVRGEWFELNPAELDAIKDYCKTAERFANPTEAHP